MSIWKTIRFSRGISGAYFKDIDLLVLEVNEPSISGMSFGFIDYVLEHPQVLDQTEQRGE